MTDRNANRPGYKKTPVGWIPKEWESRTCASICCLITKGTTPRYAFGTETADAIPFLRVQNLTFDGSLRLDGDRQFVDRHTHETDLARSRLYPGDVIINIVGPPLGKVSLVPASYPEWNINQAIAVFRAGEKCNSRYLAHYLQSHPARTWLVSQAKKTSGQQNLTLETCGELPLPLPPLPEQKKIADILSEWDESIDQTRTLIAGAKRRKKALMQQLLTGKMRLSAFPNSHGMSTHRFCDIPADWRYPKLGDIATEYSERNTSRSRLTVLACSKHRGFVESAEYFRKQVFSKDTSNYKVIRHGWFGFPSNHVEEGSIGLLLTHDVGMVSPIYTVFKTIDAVLPEFLFAVFKTETYRHIFQISTSGSVDRRGSLRWGEFSVIRVPLPSLPEQRAIAAVLATADEEINSMEAKCTALERQKKGLIQKLLTGEVRVQA